MFYDRLQQILEQKGLNITPFVASLGMSPGTIGSWKAGSEPRNSTKKKIADALGVDVSVFSDRSAPYVNEHGVTVIPADPAKVAEEEAERLRLRDENRENMRQALNGMAQYKSPQPNEAEGTLDIAAEVERFKSSLSDSSSLMLSGEIDTIEAAEFFKNSLELLKEQAKKINEEAKRKKG